MVCMICDTPQRHECKGIISHTGYYACERCTLRGESIGGAVRFNAEHGTRPRTDKLWPLYLLEEGTDPVRSFLAHML